MPLTRAQRREVAESLKEKGHVEAALEFLLDTGTESVPTEPTLNADALTPTDGRDYLTQKQLNRLEANQVTQLREQHNDLYVRSLKMLGQSDAPVAA